MASPNKCFVRRRFFVGMATFLVAILTAGIALPVACPGHKCFYKDCTKISASVWRHFDDCTIGGNVQFQAHFGESTQNFGALRNKNPPTFIDYWNRGGGTTTCSSSVFPIEANCRQGTGSRDGTIACAYCEDASS